MIYIQLALIIELIGVIAFLMNFREVLLKEINKLKHDIQQVKTSQRASQKRERKLEKSAMTSK